MNYCSEPPHLLHLGLPRPALPMNLHRTKPGLIAVKPSRLSNIAVPLTPTLSPRRGSATVAFVPIGGLGAQCANGFGEFSPQGRGRAGGKRQ
jgi:hypothetical protein